MSAGHASDGGKLPAIGEPASGGAGAMRERGRPDPRQHEAMPLVERTATAIQAVLPVIEPIIGAVQEEVVGAFAIALAIVDFVRPGVGDERLETVSKALVHL